MPARLVLGPLLRHIGEREATVWVETDRACEVDVRGHAARTFQVDGRHYAIVANDGLEPGGAYEYEVRLGGDRVWPEPDSNFPPSTIRTLERAVMNLITISSAIRWQLRMFEPPSDLVMPSRNMIRLRSSGVKYARKEFKSMGDSSVT